MKIEKVYNHKTHVFEYKARFQLNRREFTPKAATKRELIELVDEIRMQENRRQNGLIDVEISPLLKDLFARHLSTITKKNHRIFFERVSNKLLELLPAEISVTELKRAHLQLYIDYRLKQRGELTKQFIQPQTVHKEIYSVSAALSNAPAYFAELENYRKPVMPRFKGKKARRERLVSEENELDIILAELRKPRTGKQNERHYFHRTRLADWLEFGFLTGLRRKEIARLEWRNYFPKESALRDVKRWKTDTVTKYFPLPRRAVEILEARRPIQNPKYIFTPDGEPVEANYRTLKNVCEKLGIVYGRYADGGFVIHDLRHNFASEIVQVTDLETAKSLTGHSGDEIFTYLHTNEQRQREAVSKRERRDSKAEIIELYKGVRRGRVKAKGFLEQVRVLANVRA